MLWQQGIEASRAYTRDTAPNSQARQADIEGSQQPAAKPRPKSLPLLGLPERDQRFLAAASRMGSYDDMSTLTHPTAGGLGLLSATVMSPSRRHRRRQEKNLAQLHELLSIPPTILEGKSHRARKHTNTRSLDASKVRLPLSLEPELFSIRDKLRKQGRPLGRSL